MKSKSTVYPSPTLMQYPPLLSACLATPTLLPSIQQLRENYLQACSTTRPELSEAGRRTKGIYPVAKRGSDSSVGPALMRRNHSPPASFFATVSLTGYGISCRSEAS